MDERGSSTCGDSTYLATVVTDVLGLTSLHTRSAAHKLYRFAVLVAMTTAHFAFEDVITIASETKSFFFKIQILWHFASFFAIFLLQLVRGAAVAECHSKCASLPPVRPLRSFLFHFLVFVTHALIVYAFYRPVLLYNFYYFVVLRFYIQVPGLQFEYLFASLLKRMEEVNAALERFVRGAQHRETDEKLLVCRREYARLTELAASVTSAYSCQTLVMVLEFTAEIFFVLQFAFFDVIGRKQMNYVLDFALKMYIILTVFLKIITSIRPGQRYLEQCTSTNDVLCRLIDADPVVRFEARSFILQKILNPPSVSILGMVQLNYKFLYSIGCNIVSSGLIIGMFYLGVLKKKEQLD